MLNEFRKYLNSIPEVEISKQDDNTISFSYKTYQLLFIYDNADPYYFRLILPNITNLEGLEGNIEDIMNDYNSKFKVSKMTKVNDSLWISVEQFIYTNDKLNELFSRLVNLIVVVAADFKKEHFNK